VLSVNAGTYNYPVKSINLSSAPKAAFYVGYDLKASGLEDV
jgi:hypothetical protein